jgi:hypothetical protein
MIIRHFPPCNEDVLLVLKKMSANCASICNHEILVTPCGTWDGHFKKRQKFLDELKISKRKHSFWRRFQLVCAAPELYVQCGLLYLRLCPEYFCLSHSKCLSVHYAVSAELVRHCATSREVAGSVPDEIIGYFLQFT